MLKKKRINISGKWVHKLSPNEEAFLRKKSEYSFGCNRSMGGDFYVRMSAQNGDVLAYYIVKQGYVECYNYITREHKQYKSLCIAINAIERISKNRLKSA